MINRTIDKILLFTNPLTYVVLLVMLLHLAIDEMLRYLRLKDLFFILFKAKNLDDEGLFRLAFFAQRNLTSTHSNMWIRWISNLALNKIKNIKIK